VTAVTGVLETNGRIERLARRHPAFSPVRSSVIQPVRRRPGSNAEEA
jgi:hypothetical protein